MIDRPPTPETPPPSAASPEMAADFPFTRVDPVVADHPDQPAAPEFARPDAEKYAIAAEAHRPTPVAYPPDRARVPDPSVSPKQTHVFPIAPTNDLRAVVDVARDSSLAGRYLDFVSRGRLHKDAHAAYPHGMEVTQADTGATVIRAEADRYISQRPVNTGVISSDGRREAEIPAVPAPNQRNALEPPDEIRIDTLYTPRGDHKAAADAVEGLLKGYVTDAVDRLTVPDPEVKGAFWFTAEAVADGWTSEPRQELHFRDSLIGDSKIGINRITLVCDYRSDVRVDNPVMAAIGDALARFGCEVVPGSIKTTRIDSPVPTAVELQFRRRGETIIDDGYRPQATRRAISDTPG